MREIIKLRTSRMPRVLRGPPFTAAERRSGLNSVNCDGQPLGRQYATLTGNQVGRSGAKVFAILRWTDMPSSSA